MITAALALIGMTIHPQADTPTGAQVISAMLARYAGLSSLTGNIRLVVQAKAQTGSVAEEVDTVVQFQKPNLLYLRQDRSAPYAKSWLVTSDGVHFSYNYPNNQEQPAFSDRLLESVNSLDVAHIYAAASMSLGDRSVPLGVALSWNDELKRIVANWPTHELAGEVSTDNGKAWKVTGTYSEVPNGPAVGKYYLIINKQGDLLEYATLQEMATPLPNSRVGDIKYDSQHPTILTQTWQVRLEPNGRPISSLFKVVQG